MDDVESEGRASQRGGDDSDRERSGRLVLLLSLLLLSCFLLFFEIFPSFHFLDAHGRERGGEEGIPLNTKYMEMKK